MVQGKYLVSIFGRGLPGKICHNEAEVKGFLASWYNQHVIADGRFAKTKFGYVFVNDRIGGPEVAQIVKV
jgi:hypothetical protein